MSVPSTLPPDPNAPIKLIAAAQLALYAIHEELCTWASGRATCIGTRVTNFPSAALAVHTFTTPEMFISSTQARLAVDAIWQQLSQGQPEPVGTTVGMLPILVTVPSLGSDLPYTVPDGWICRVRTDSRLSITGYSTETIPGDPRSGYTHKIHIWFGWL